MKKLLYLIDTFSLVFQVFHAIPHMTGPKGEPTNAIFGFIRDLQLIRQQKQPTHLILAMDSEGPGERVEWYADYKANRDAMPEDLKPQIPVILDVAKGYNIPAVKCPGWEADDIIATLTKQAVAEGFDVRIVTSDKDARQLLGPQVQLFNCRKNSFLDEEFLRKDWGISPEQVIDFQGMVGDSSDNIPGVPKIGPKTATALLEQFGSLDEILARTEEISKKQARENLQTYAEQARISRQLATLKNDLPLDFDLETSAVQEPNAEELLELFTQYGFRRYSEEMREVLQGGSGSASNQQQEAPEEFHWETIDSQKKFDSFAKELKKQKHICLDLETTGLQPAEAEIVGWAICWKPGLAYYLPVQGPDGDSVLDNDAALELFREVLTNPEVTVSNQNIKYDLIVLRRYGITGVNISVDPMVGDYLLDAGERSHGLDTLARRYLEREMISIKELIGSGKKQKKMFEVEVDKAAEYAAEDADVAFQLALIIEQRLKDEGLWDLYWDLERPLIPVLVEMEWNGIRVDVDELKRQSEELTARLEELEAEIHTIAGHEFNIASPKQLQHVLFEELKLPIIKKTKTGPSTDAEVLEKLAPKHELPAKVSEHRQLSKLKGTYLDALPKLVNPETGNIHASFNQVVAATGRLSSSDPNLQNIPIRTEAGRKIRKAFVPSRDGWQLLCADYSQIELRVLAHFSGDEALMSAFRENRDVHRAVAADIFNVTESDVTSEMRGIAKTVNFGVIYGQSPFGLSSTLGIPQDEAAAFIDAYLTQYAGVARFIGETLETVRKKGYATTILGRRRPFTGIRESSSGKNGWRGQMNLPERTAFNTVIQGSAADLIKQAMINLFGKLQEKDHPARLLLQIHDELVLEAPEAEISSLKEIVVDEMQSAMELKVPLVVDVGVAANWLDAK
ncbi:DNA polymerase I [Calycomorphotria hydatis]|uniref:DNA polymerase I n=1 Tax=Calycomorphotria hydatis TaxID=2528027 RepID=A0A517TD33_9PLAN|nr:DNA polymerase I [Calycomorphotria hydatis]QDT66282.1 DNA polymerase I [Calycomorphotria hydatis]